MSTPVPPRPTSPPEAWEPLLRLVRLASRPLERFLHIQAASGILLLVAAAVALAWANSPWAESYTRLWHTPVGFRLGAFSFERSLEWVVNDGLMVIFFFVVGMEIRREVHHGELSEWRRAALPIAAALGGMLAPALLYLAFAGAPETKSGWGVPMATDIAFALGILTLLGQRVPPALRVLLLALAVIDDLGAIVVIALFYSSGVSLVGLLTAALGFVGVLAMQRVGVRSKWAYVVPALVAWAGIYAAGIHPTIAGVIVGLMTPVRAWLGPQGLLVDVRQELETLGQQAKGAHSPEDLSRVLRHVDVARREALSPAESLIESLHPWVAFGIMPVFALANAGVQLSGGTLGASAWSVAMAVAVGLVVGKPVGVLLAIGATLRLRIGTLPAGLTVRHLVVLGLVAGVGFTMALFIAQLAFTDPGLLAGAKLGVLAASACAAVLALVLGRLLLSPVPPGNAARSADEAESSTEL
ncbi:Na+/H+ antiporter NhaA [Myxococcus faecalis]|uniref:Na+/H+ antiporter NhaA n=1 Tax=Myxococcus TaxID=32 RepID=UPI001CBEB809|nr:MULTISPECIES: Na+/H+ antiporter NhaA [unclassified Myxococcus]MBZ4399889.1 Na+/H+ antiporter NhaA [Myxococcus sp. AS-1-15]MBZ4409954.1 Na+/H+ antiporter NhaA [Myxococcus sp. XM-1-1-1]BDT32373.1 Na/H antiporter NhaA [Myxococcus sp. MH1]